MEYGIILKKSMTAICVCEDVFSIRSWHNAGNLYCKKCGNRSWVSTKAIKGTGVFTLEAQSLIEESEGALRLRKVVRKALIKGDPPELEIREKELVWSFRLEGDDAIVEKSGKFNWAGFLGKLPYHDIKEIKGSLSRFIAKAYWGLPLRLVKVLLVDIHYPEDLFDRKIKEKMELLYKSLPQDIAASLITEVLGRVAKRQVDDSFNLKATTPYGFLNISRAVFKLLREGRVEAHLYSLGKVQYEVETIGFNNVVECYSRIGESVSQIVRLVKDFGYDTGTLISYVDRVEQYQALTKDAALNYLYDYRRMARDLERDVDKYPKNPKVAHDLVMRDYEIKEDAIRQAKFKAATESQALILEGEVDDIMFLVPRSPEDLEEEGRRMHHCVYSYTNRVADGTSAIVFVRDQSGNSLATIECDLSSKRVVQVKAAYNKEPKKEVMDRIRKWVGKVSLSMQS